MTAKPRIVLFADCFEEVNGVALTCRQLTHYARQQQLPLLAVHAGVETASFCDGSVERLQLRRGPVRIPLDPDFDFDLAFNRYLPRVARAIDRFQPDLIHITGSGDIGILGAIVAWQKKIPLVASWHTNVHEFAARRMDALAPRLPGAFRAFLTAETERFCLSKTLRYYRMAQAIFAPNIELVAMLHQRTGRPAYHMPRGVDSVQFSPERRTRKSGPLRLGYVGRLTSEKNVRLLADVSAAFQRARRCNYEIVIVGHGPEERWLRQLMVNTVFTGVLRGDALAEAYANLDLFLFPSHTDAFGNVVQEAQASGVPALVTASGGPKFLVQSGVNGIIAQDDSSFVRLALELAADPNLDQMGVNARRNAESRSWSRVFDNLYHTYRQVAFRSNRRAKPAETTACKASPA